MLFAKCFCPDHVDDINQMPQYVPDALTRKRARARARKKELQ